MRRAIPFVTSFVAAALAALLYLWLRPVPASEPTPEPAPEPPAAVDRRDQAAESAPVRPEAPAAPAGEHRPPRQHSPLESHLAERFQMNSAELEVCMALLPESADFVVLSGTLEPIGDTGQPPGSEVSGLRVTAGTSQPAEVVSCFEAAVSLHPHEPVERATAFSVELPRRGRR